MWQQAVKSIATSHVTITVRTYVRCTFSGRHRFDSNPSAQEVFKEQMLNLMWDGRLSKAEMTLYANSHGKYEGRGLREQAQQREERYTREKDGGGGGSSSGSSNGGGGTGTDMGVGSGGGGNSSSGGASGADVRTGSSGGSSSSSNSSSSSSSSSRSSNSSSSGSSNNNNNSGSAKPSEKNSEGERGTPTMPNTVSDSTVLRWMHLTGAKHGRHKKGFSDKRGDGRVVEELHGYAQRQ
jgi:hypothetical protein